MNEYLNKKEDPRESKRLFLNDQYVQSQHIDFNKNFQLNNSFSGKKRLMSPRSLIKKMLEERKHDYLTESEIALAQEQYKIQVNQILHLKMKFENSKVTELK